MVAPRSATNRPEAAQAAIGEANRKLAELVQRRNEALLRDRDSDAAALALEIQEAQRLVQGHSDKIPLLKQAAADEERERKVREREGLIKRIEAKHAAPAARRS